MRCVMKILALILIMAVNLHAAEPYYNGEIRFPAKKLFNQEQGTYEVWFKQELPVDDKRIKISKTTSRPICNFFLVAKNGLKDSNRKKGEQNFIFMNYGLFLNNDKFTIGAGFNGVNARVGRVLKPLNLEQDKWHYGAITWKNTGQGKFRVVSYLNGKELRKSEDTYSKSDKLDSDSVIYSIKRFLNRLCY